MTPRETRKMQNIHFHGNVRYVQKLTICEIELRFSVHPSVDRRRHRRLLRVKMTRCEHLQPTHNRQHHPMSIAIMDHTMPTGQPAGDRDSWRGRDPRDKLMINLMILLAGNMESRALSEKARRVLYLTTDSIG